MTKTNWSIKQIEGALGVGAGSKDIDVESFSIDSRSIKKVW